MSKPTPDSAANLPPMPSFEDFYQAVNNRAPFPWQSRLARTVAQDGKWPAEIGIPTGMGKTACLEVAVWWLASEAHLPPSERRAPTRIWWVVNRRLLVDSTHEHASQLSKTLRESDSSGVMGAVATRLLSLSANSASPNSRPLDVIRLRGGVSSRTPVDPSVPTIVLCTLPMYGSRLLFRGYGSRLRSVDAAMAGTDSIVLLDEAHLAPHLKKLLRDLRECHPQPQDVLANARAWPTLVALTATGDHAQKFDLDDDDRSHPEIKKRLNATKPMRVLEPKGKPATHLAEAAEEVLSKSEDPTSVLVFANTPKIARETFDRLHKQAKKHKATTLLLTGRVREYEADRIRSVLLAPGTGMSASSTAAETGREQHLVVVATQTLEVGADLDAEHLITEQCGTRALTQRLGRLNRLGRHGHASATYFHFESEKRRDTAWPVYSEEPDKVLEDLKKAGGLSGDNAFLDMSPGNISNVLGEPDDSTSHAPEIMPEILREWVKTTLPDRDEAPVEPYFSGLTAVTYRVSVVWRIHLPEDKSRVWPRITEDESIDVPIGELKESFGTPLGECMVTRLQDDGASIEEVTVAQLRPGDTVILPADQGKMDEFGWNPAAKEAVMDVSILCQGLPLDDVAIGRLFSGAESKEGSEDGVAAWKEVATRIKQLSKADDEAEDFEVDLDALGQEILTLVKALPVPPSWARNECDKGAWKQFVDNLSPTIRESQNEVPRLMVKQPKGEFRYDAFDEMSITTSSSDARPGLKEHGEDVGKRASEIAKRLGLPDELAQVVGLAAKLHDIGKADSRFQCWLDPKSEAPGLLAKSGAPRSRWASQQAPSGWPKGGRHEALSARLVYAWLEKHPEAFEKELMRDLLMHLVISHHGRGRPLVMPVRDNTERPVAIDIEGEKVEVPASLAEIDWEQPSRFRRLNDHFGAWGLSLLEATLIRADHAVSGGDRIVENITDTGDTND